MQKTQTICLIVLATIAVGFSLALLKTVLLPFVVAVFIVIGCRPILQYLEFELKFPKYIAFAVTFVAGLLVFTAFALLVWISITDLSRNIGAYEQRLDHIAEWVVERLPESKQNKGSDELTSSALLIEETDSTRNLQSDDDPNGIAKSDINDTGKALDELLTHALDLVRTQMLGLASSLTSLMSYGVLILIFVFFLLMGSPSSNPETQPDESQSTTIILGQIESQIRKYLVVKTIISVLTGLAFGLVLWLFGVPLAILFGFLAFLLNFIPNIGPLISSLLPVPFLILNSNMSPLAAGTCFLLCAAIQFISGNIIETKIMGKSFDVSPVFLLLALMFFGLIWGIVGMFLATPLVSIVKIVLDQTQMGKPVAELMAGRWSENEMVV